MDLVTVYTSLNAADADLIKGRLESADFNVSVKNSDAGIGVETGRGVMLQVPEDEAEEARALLQYQESGPS